MNHTVSRSVRGGAGDAKSDDRRRLCARGEGGMVTAEAALVLPIVAAFALAMVFLVSTGLTKLASVDAARDAARAIARGDDEASVRSRAEASGPAGAQVSVSSTGRQVTVEVAATVRSPNWLLIPFPAIRVSSSATVEEEPDAEAP